MKDFLLFRRIITPCVIQLLFWLGVAVCVYVGVFGLFNRAIVTGLCVLVLGPLFVRVVCEYLIVQFKIYEKLRSIESQKKRAV